LSVQPFVGKLTHGYAVNPRPRRIEEFEGVIAQSFRPEATFLNSLLLVRFYPGASHVIHNLTAVESHANESTVRQLKDRSELITTIVDRFGMPRSIVAEVVGELGEFQDAWA
jgi:arylamine N-acetyltransferase